LEWKISEKINIATKNAERTICIEKTVTHKFLSPSWGSIGSSRAGGHE
jgi:hypothetical protein